MPSWSKIKFYYDENLAAGALTASSTASGYDVANVLDRFEGTYWRAANTNDQFLNWDAGEGNLYTSDFFSLAGHNLFTIRALVKLQYSHDNVKFYDCFDAYLPSDDKAKVKEFSSITARFWRVSIAPADSSSSSSSSSSLSSSSSSVSSSSTSSSSESSSSVSSSSSSFSSSSSCSSSFSSSSSSWALLNVAQIAICFFGQKTELDYADASFDPHGQDDKANVNVSHTGFVTGIHNTFIERNMKLGFSDADSALYDKLKLWIDNNGQRNFFVAWEDSVHADDVFLMRANKKANNPLVRGGLYRNLNVNLVGRKET
jgi:hypothetical protein